MAATNPITQETSRFSIRLPRPLWIGLAAAVFVVLAIGLHFGVPIYRKHVAIQEVERLGGQVSSLPAGPDWLRGSLFVRQPRLFHDVIGVRLDDTPADDDTLARLACLTNVQELRLANTQVTDAGLAHLNGLTDLRYLDLNKTRVTNAGMVHLKGFTNLERLFLDVTQVTDEGLVHLAGCSKLMILWIRSTQVSDAGLRHLEKLSSLLELQLLHTNVTDDGLAELKRAMPGLKYAYR